MDRTGRDARPGSPLCAVKWSDRCEPGRPSGPHFWESAGVGAAKGKTATVHIILSLPNGRVLDDTRKAGKPAPIPVGAPLQIQGLAEGLNGIKKGERRFLVIPHNLAFGKAGAGGAIPPFSTLLIDVECVDLK